MKRALLPLLLLLAAGTASAEPLETHNNRVFLHVVVNGENATACSTAPPK
jgi:hypothetical protein